MDKEIRRIVGINLLILLGISAILLITSGFKIFNDDGGIFIFGVTAVILVQIAINFVLAIIFFIRKRTDRGVACILSMFVVLIVGFSSCYGGAVMMF